MARNNQKLINYHTGKKTEMPSGSSVDYGEIVVRHNAEAPELLIKIGENSFGVFQASGAVQTAIGDAKVEIYNSATTFATNAINAVASNVETLSGAVSSITENYVTTDTLNTTVETLEGKISAAQKAATDASSAYTDSKIETSETYTKGLIDGVASDLKDLKTTVETNYVLTTTLNTKVEELETKISTAKDDAISSGKTYTDAQIADVKSDVTTLSANVESTINAKITNVYRYKGSCAYAALPTTGNVTGDVWNVTDANDNFPAGTNYAWDGEKWDALGGSIDLSPYATSASVKTEIDGIKQTANNLQSAIDSVSSATKTLVSDVSAATVATYATKEELKSASGNIISDYTTAIAAAKKEATDASSAYTDTKIAAAKESIKQTTDAISTNVTNLSASTVNIETTANSAIQNASIVDGDTCKVSVAKDGTNLKFNFENLVVDCGDF